jgi:hypothetical protein
LKSSLSIQQECVFELFVSSKLCLDPIYQICESYQRIQVSRIYFLEELNNYISGNFNLRKQGRVRCQITDLHFNELSGFFLLGTILIPLIIKCSFVNFTD